MEKQTWRKDLGENITIGLMFALSLFGALQLMAWILSRSIPEPILPGFPDEYYQNAVPGVLTMIPATNEEPKSSDYKLDLVEKDACADYASSSKKILNGDCWIVHIRRKDQWFNNIHVPLVLPYSYSAKMIADETEAYLKAVNAEQIDEQKKAEAKREEGLEMTTKVREIIGD